jgi:integrase
LTEGGKRGTGLSPSGEADLRWQIDKHLTPHFGRMPVDTITIETVDRYRRAKVAEGRLHATSINKTLQTLSAILEVELEYGRIATNPAKGKRRRLPAVKPRRTYLDRADHIAALLDAAGALDAEREGRTRPFRRALLALLALGGLRIGEALTLRWGDVHLADGWLRVRGTKTDAAERRVYLLPLLRDELLAHAARRRETDQNALVFPTATGARLGATNVRKRLLAPAVELANAALAKRDVEPLPDGLTPHSLRRTCASILVALGWDPARVMRTLGHTTATFTLSVYARSMDWTDGEPERLRALVEGREWAPAGTNAEATPVASMEVEPA